MEQFGDFSYDDAAAAVGGADSGTAVASWLEQSPISALASVTKKGRGTFNALNDLSTPTMHWEKQLSAAAGKLDDSRDTGFGAARLFGAAMADIKGRGLKENGARSTKEGASALWTKTFSKQVEAKKEMEALKNGKVLAQKDEKKPVVAKIGSAAKKEKVTDPWAQFKEESWEDELKASLSAQQAQKKKPVEVKIGSAPKEEKVLDPWSLLEVKSWEDELKASLTAQQGQATKWVESKMRTFPMKVQPKLGYRTPNLPIKQVTEGKDPSEIRRTSFEDEDEKENRPLPRTGNAFFGKYNNHAQSNCPTQAKTGMFTPWGRRSTFAWC